MKTIAMANMKGGVGKSSLCLALSSRAAVQMSQGTRVAIIDLDEQRSVTQWSQKRDPSLEYPEVYQQDLGVNGADLIRAAEGRGIDLLFLDLPGRSDDTVEAVLNACDLIVCPFKHSYFDTKATIEFISRVDTPLLAVLNETNPGRLSAAPPKVKEIQQKFRAAGIDIAQTYIVQREIHDVAFSRGYSVTEIYPSSPASREIKRLWDEVRSRIDI